MEVQVLDKVFYLQPSEVKTKEGLARIREEYGDIDDLASSIKTKGQIQPIVLTRDNELIVGGRRLAACTKAGIEVMCIYRDNVSDLELRELELEENLKRKALTFVEEALAIREIDKLKKTIHGNKGAGRGAGNTGWSQTDTAELIGKTKGSVSQSIALADAMDAFPIIKDAKNESEARKMLKKLEEELIVQELAKRQKARPNKNIEHASQHYMIKDALVGLREVQSGVADFLEIDTPYGIDLCNVKKSQSADELNTAKNYTEWSLEAYKANIKVLAKETFRILKDDAWGVWWYGQEHYQFLLEALKEAGFYVDKIPAIWSKGKGMAQTNQPELYLARGYEVFFIVRKGNPALRKRGRVNVFDFTSVHASQRIHPTEKPIELICELLDTFAYPNSIILCPFLGSGNTLRAAYMKGMTGFGFELGVELKTKFLARVAADIESKLYGGNTDATGQK